MKLFFSSSHFFSSKHFLRNLHDHQRFAVTQQAHAARGGAGGVGAPDREAVRQLDRRDGPDTRRAGERDLARGAHGSRCDRSGRGLRQCNQ